MQKRIGQNRKTVKCSNNTAKYKKEQKHELEILPLEFPCGSAVMNPPSIHEDAGSIPGAHARTHTHTCTHATTDAEIRTMPLPTKERRTEGDKS